MKPEPIYKAIGALIRARRRLLELSQKELAAELGFSRATLANVETGRQRILVHQLYAFAKALKLNAESLLPGASKNQPADLSKLTIQGDLSSQQREQIAIVLGSELPTPNPKDMDDKTTKGQTRATRRGAS